ncbi:hypothetical protein AGMMS49593_08000 [Endomicrobiia bacterium]|nr:hypothetical protein AGMMS49593_08000 [Endomicrobiia bacterium]
MGVKKGTFDKTVRITRREEKKRKGGREVSKIVSKIDIEIAGNALNCGLTPSCRYL